MGLVGLLGLNLSLDLDNDLLVFMYSLQNEEGLTHNLSIQAGNQK